VVPDFSHAQVDRPVAVSRVTPPSSETCTTSPAFKAVLLPLTTNMLSLVT